MFEGKKHSVAAAIAAAVLAVSTPVLADTREDVNARQPDGSTPLQWAAFAGDVAEAKRLIAAGADVIIPGQMIFAEILWQNGVNRIDEAPVIDALGACLKMAESLVDLKRVSGVSHTRRGFWGARPPTAVVEAARRRYLRL